MKHARTAAVFALVTASLTVGAALAGAPAGHYAIANGIVYDTKTNLAWQQNVTMAMYTHAEALALCATLKLNGETWRLPTMREILTIVDLSVPPPGPTIDAVAFPDTPAGFFWSSTPYSGTPGNAWAAMFYYGFAYGNSMTDTSYVRCAHAGPPRASTR